MHAIERLDIEIVISTSYKCVNNTSAKLRSECTTGSKVISSPRVEVLMIFLIHMTLEGDLSIINSNCSQGDDMARSGNCMHALKDNK